MNKPITYALILIFSFIILILPIITNAQFTECHGSDCTVSGGSFYIILTKISRLFNAIIPVLVALGVVYFVWGVVQYVIQDSEEAKKKGRDHMIYGIIGLAVIVSLWGLVYVLVDFLYTGNNYAPTPYELNRLLPQ